MKTTKHKSIFNLIEIFRKGKTNMIARINAATHCKNKSIHDYYCDAEKPYVASANE